MTNNLGPGPMHRSETSSGAKPVAGRTGGSFGSSSSARPIAGLITVLIIVGIVVMAVGLFRGSFTTSVPVTVLSPRAGLVMNPDAKVQMRGVQVGTVSSIVSQADGQAAIHLDMDPGALHLIPANVKVDVASSTVFGAKFVNLVAPQDPSPQPMHSGQVLESDHVTVEINTVFQQLTQVLDKIDPTKLNETLGAMSEAFAGRGEKFGQSLTDFEALLEKLEPSLPNMSRDIELLTPVANAYADAAPDLLRTLDNSSTISDSIVDEQQNLDAFLVSMIGLADIGNDVVGTNQPVLSEVLRLLVPTTDVLREYAPGLNCSLEGMAVLSRQPPAYDPGVAVNVAFTLGIERYRYPMNLPKVGASGGPQCMGLPRVPFGQFSKYLVTDTNANPWQYGNQGILLNSDGLKQRLFGPLDGPPRNTAQIGQPG